MDFNLNEAMKNKTTKYVVYFVVIILVGLVGYLIFNGKHNKISLKEIETNIPPPPTNKPDTTVINNYNDSHKEVNIKENKGDILVK